MCLSSRGLVEETGSKRLVVPRFGTLLAVPEELDAAARDAEAVLAGQLLVYCTAMTTLELDYLSAAETNQMLVLLRLHFISRVISSELELAY
jgi:hypothetical protein